MWDRDWQDEIRLVQKREKNSREILGVSDSASKEDIKRAWRREILKHHPDHNGGSGEVLPEGDVFTFVSSITA